MAPDTADGNAKDVDGSWMGHCHERCTPMFHDVSLIYCLLYLYDQNETWLIFPMKHGLDSVRVLAGFELTGHFGLVARVLVELQWSLVTGARIFLECTISIDEQ